MISTESKTNNKEDITCWKDKYRFPFGAILLILFQWLSGMGAFCYILIMPIYMSSILGFSDTQSTVIFHVRSVISNFFIIFGAVIADSLLGRLKAYLYLQPFDILLMGGIIVASIYTSVPVIISLYFLVAIIGGLILPGLRSFIADQIPSNNLIMLSTYLHVIYLVHNFGIIIVGYITPIMHKDVYCFETECYPLIFAVSILLTSSALILFICGYCCNVFVINKPTNNLFVNILRCIGLAIKRRIKLGKLENGKSFLDYAEGEFGITFIRDIKKAKGLCIFLLAHPLFWTVFEQLSSVWTLQAQYMDGMVSDTFIIKADQMMTLNPLLVVIIIPIFEILIYPLLNKINFKVPYRIMVGQMFTALACLSMIFIQLNIDNSLKSAISVDQIQINFLNLGKSNLSTLSSGQVLNIERLKILTFTVKKENYLSLKSEKVQLNKSLINYGNILTAVIIPSNITGVKVLISNVVIQQNGGYSSIRLLNLIDKISNIELKIKARVGINKICSLKSNYEEFGAYTKCGIGVSDIVLISKGNERILGSMTLCPAETKTLIIKGQRGSEKVIEMSEIKLMLPSIFWQILPYILVTTGEVLFNVNTGIFLYSEAPLSMKSILLAAQLVCIAIGNIFILLLKQILKDVSGVYLFLICGVLVTFSGILTGILGYFYLQNAKFLEVKEDESSVKLIK